MRVALVALHELDEWTIWASGLLYKHMEQNPLSGLDLEFWGARKLWPFQKAFEIEGLELFDINSLNCLSICYQKAVDEGLDFVIFNFGRGVPIKPERVKTLLLGPALRNCIWSFRISGVAGVGMKQPSRMPYIDDHFLLLNVEQATNKQYFSREMLKASHFVKNGFNSWLLTSMAEASIKKEELNNHYTVTHDLYGNEKPLNPLPFSICEETSFVTVYPELSKSTKTLLELNFGKKASLLTCLRYKRKGDYWFKRRFLNISSWASWLGRNLLNPKKFAWTKSE